MFWRKSVLAQWAWPRVSVVKSGRGFFLGERGGSWAWFYAGRGFFAGVAGVGRDQECARGVVGGLDVCSQT